MKWLLAATVLAFPLAGCGGTTRPATDLTVVALNPNIGRAEFHLTCKPASGDLPRPRRTCEALAAHPTLITNPKPFMCAGGPFSWWDIRISGRLGGKHVDRTVSTCWTPQMAMIGQLHVGRLGVLHSHLVPRRHEAVLPGTTVTYTPGTLRATDLVTCNILSHHLEAGVPVETGQPSGTGFGGNDVITVNLTITHNTDGSVTATCRRGTRGPASRASHHA